MVEFATFDQFNASLLNRILLWPKLCVCVYNIVISLNYILKYSLSEYSYFLLITWSHIVT